ncbi:MAG: hypothetical protein KAG62_08080 [Caulobacter sp.]|nr:hypothetical protein [Caulobacter sp.]
MNKVVITPQAGAPRQLGKPPVTWRRRLDVGSRIVAGLVMGYVVAALAAAVLARLLPMSKVEATTTGMLASFAVYAGAAIWAFGDPKAWRVWAGLLAASALMAGALWLSIALGGQA